MSNSTTDTTKEPRNWTVILHFGRGHSTIFKDLTKAEAQEHLRIAVFANEDSVNAQVFRS